jgi:hypothetical protein
MLLFLLVSVSVNASLSVHLSLSMPLSLLTVCAQGCACPTTSRSSLHHQKHRPISRHPTNSRHLISLGAPASYCPACFREVTCRLINLHHQSRHAMSLSAPISCSLSRL